MKVAHLYFRGSVHHDHAGKHGDMQADVMLELRALTIVGSGKSTDCPNEGSLGKIYLKAHPTVTYFLQ